MRVAGDSTPVDIILPVHNASRDFRLCVESLIRHWTKGPYRILVIDDGSTETEVSDVLNGLKDNEFVIIRRHETSQGIIRTENEAIAMSENDVVLLNSDTIVTEGWLHKLIEVAYSKRSIGLVTPLSNKASTYSWPLNMPEDLSIEDIADCVEAHSLRMLPRIPVGVGFCLYIKRDVIRRVGLLDEETFGRGYAEENDFCLRARTLGYETVLADNIFIYHKGGVSHRAVGYLKEGNITVPENEVKLLRKHPEYLKLTEEFESTGAMWRIRTQLDFWLTRKLVEKRPRILYWVHNQVFKGVVGGTEIHVEKLVTSFRGKAAVYVASGNPADRAYVQEFIDDWEFTYLFPVNATTFKVTDLAWKGLARTILRLFHPDIVHIHHTLNSTLDIAEAAKEVEIPIVLSIHDYYAICPNLNLINSVTDNYCDIPRDLSVCSSCLKHMFGLTDFSLPEWRQEMAKIVQQCDYVIYPSAAARAVFHRMFNPEKEAIIEHGIENSILETTSEAGVSSQTRNFSVGFVGYMAPQKGSKLIAKALPKLLESGLEVHFFGDIGSEISKDNRSGLLFLHGKFDSTADLIRMLKKSGVKVICIPSPWPETYSLTLSETWVAGIPVIVSPYGALEERVNVTGAGLVMKELTSDELVKRVEQLAKSTSLYDSLVMKTSNIRHRTVSKMADDYLRLYSSLWGNVPSLIPDGENVFMMQQEFARSSFVIQSQEANSLLNLRFRKAGVLGQSAEHQSLSEQVWATINAIFPETRFGRFMKVTVGFYMYAAEYGLRNTIKRIIYLRRRGTARLPTK